MVLMFVRSSEGLATQYGAVDRDENWSSLWIVAWEHQPITLTIGDISSIETPRTNITESEITIKLFKLL